MPNGSTNSSSSYEGDNDNHADKPSHRENEKNSHESDNSSSSTKSFQSHLSSSLVSDKSLETMEHDADETKHTVRKKTRRVKATKLKKNSSKQVNRSERLKSHSKSQKNLPVSSHVRPVHHGDETQEEEESFEHKKNEHTVDDAGTEMVTKSSPISEDDYSRRQGVIREHSPNNRYARFNELLGEGAFKKVYLAYDSMHGMEVAWNVVKLGGMNSAAQLRVVKEMQILQTLNHKSIMKFYGSWFNKETKSLVFITEVMSSGTLKEFINNRPVRLRIVKRWCRHILNALVYLHEEHTPGIIHRDLKCANIFINGNSGEIRIGDLGLASWEREGNARSVLGTPEYMAPEMFEENYDEKVDIYAFGMCVLEMVTKQTPYEECTSTPQIYKKVMAGEPPAAFHTIDHPVLKNFIWRCIQKPVPLAVENEVYGTSDHSVIHTRPAASDLRTDPFLEKNDSNPEDDMDTEFLIKKDAALILKKAKVENNDSLGGKSADNIEKTMEIDDFHLGEESSVNNVKENMNDPLHSTSKAGNHEVEPIVKKSVHPKGPMQEVNPLEPSPQQTVEAKTNNAKKVMPGKPLNVPPPPLIETNGFDIKSIAKHICPVGSFVETKINNRDRWHSGIVERINFDGTYDVKYADEDYEGQIHPSLIRYNGNAVSDLMVKDVARRKVLQKLSWDIIMEYKFPQGYGGLKSERVASNDLEVRLKFDIDAITDDDAEELPRPDSLYTLQREIKHSFILEESSASSIADLFLGEDSDFGIIVCDIQVAEIQKHLSLLLKKVVEFQQKSTGANTAIGINISLRFSALDQSLDLSERLLLGRSKSDPPHVQASLNVQHSAVKTGLSDARPVSGFAFINESDPFGLDQLLEPAIKASSNRSSEVDNQRENNRFASSSQDDGMVDYPDSEALIPKDNNSNSSDHQVTACLDDLKEICEASSIQLQEYLTEMSRINTMLSADNINSLFTLMDAFDSKQFSQQTRTLYESVMDLNSLISSTQKKFGAVHDRLLKIYSHVDSSKLSSNASDENEALEDDIYSDVKMNVVTAAKQMNGGHFQKLEVNNFDPFNDIISDEHNGDNFLSYANNVQTSFSQRTTVRQAESAPNLPTLNKKKHVPLDTDVFSELMDMHSTQNGN